MDDALGALVGGVVLLSLALAALAFVVVAALIAVVVLGPPIAGGFALRRLLIRYRLSKRLKRRSIGLSVILFCGPLLLILIDHETWPIALWSGVTMSLSGLVLFLALEGFRQHFLSLRKESLSHQLRGMAASLSVFANRYKSWRIAVMRKSVRRRFGTILHERQRMEDLASEIIGDGDSRFLSSERLRLNRVIRGSSRDEIHRLLQETLAALRQTPSKSPQYQTLRLHAGLFRLVLCERQIDSKIWHTWRNSFGKEESIRAGIEILEREIEAHRNGSKAAALSIKMKKRQMLPLS